MDHGAPNLNVEALPKPRDQHAGHLFLECDRGGPPQRLDGAARRGNLTASSCPHDWEFWGALLPGDIPAAWKRPGQGRRDEQCEMRFRIARRQRTAQTVHEFRAGGVNRSAFPRKWKRPRR